MSQLLQEQLILLEMKVSASEYRSAELLMKDRAGSSYREDIKQDLRTLHWFFKSVNFFYLFLFTNLELHFTQILVLIPVFRSPKVFGWLNALWMKASHSSSAVNKTIFRLRVLHKMLIHSQSYRRWKVILDYICATKYSNVFYFVKPSAQHNCLLTSLHVQTWARTSSCCFSSTPQDTQAILHMWGACQAVPSTLSSCQST